ncbi:MAG: hypothetical protein HS104_38780 [Polyangiaceae bacterium]|nr:hypothetical protein [Polyangiaceae bacterium]MCE7888641.1 hypothetical protein [Sorangiineae bacterium PRO1]MCL4754821.1 hypothetical protein [Myxococcales bacterium]
MAVVDHAAAARRLAEALDTAFGGARTWHVTRGALDTVIALEQGAHRRPLAYVRDAGGQLEVLTPGSSDGPRRFVLDDDVAEVVVAVVAAAATLTLWDLVPGRRFRLLTPFRGLSAGEELALVSIEEVKPSGRDLYRFVRSAGSLDLYCDRPEDAAVLDCIDELLVPID